MIEKISDFTDLKVWQKCHVLTIELYKITNSFPKEELFGLTNQIRRCVTSINANIAEGFGRKTAKDQLHFYYQANGSALELRNHLLVARDVGYLATSDWEEVNGRAIEICKMLSGLIRAHSSKT